MINNDSGPIDDAVPGRPGFGPTTSGALHRVDGRVRRRSRQPTSNGCGQMRARFLGGLILVVAFGIMAPGAEPNHIETAVSAGGGGTAATSALRAGAAARGTGLSAISREVATGPPTTVTAAPPATTTTTTTSGTTRLAAVPVPPEGEASAYGCAAAMAYLSAYEAPGFSAACPAYSDGYQATTSCRGARCTAGERLITITVPCAEAYMNEASNSQVLAGLSQSPIDPYGYCH